MLKIYRIDKFIIILLSILLISFICYKSHITSFTHDESYTYNHYVHQSLSDIVSYADPFTNNHILNTLMMKGNEFVFGSDELALRLQSILALAGYLFFCFKLIRQTPVTTRLICFLLLITNPYLIDFFGLARGYALSICFMTGGIYYVMRWLETRSLKHLALFNIFALLACYSNFSLINFYISAFGSINLIQLIWARTGEGNSVKRSGNSIYWFKSNAVNLFFMFLTALILWEPIRKISKQHMLDFGGKSDIVSDTISSVIVNSFYHVPAPPNIVAIIAWAVVVAILISLILWVYLLVEGGKGAYQKLHMLMFVNTTLIGILVMVIAQHYTLDNDYFVGRFALFLFPLFIFNLIFCFSLLYETRFKRVSVALPAILALLLASNLLFNINMRSYLDWEYDMDTRQMMNVLEKQHNSLDRNKRVRLGITWWYEPTVNFYRQVRKMDWLEPADREELIKEDHYFYSTENKIVRLKKPPLHILFSSGTGAVLVINK